MERSVAAAAGKRVDIADDGAFTVPAGSDCWVFRLFPSGGLVGDATGITTFPGGRRGHCISLQSGHGVDSRDWHM